MAPKNDTDRDDDDNGDSSKEGRVVVDANDEGDEAGEQVRVSLRMAPEFRDSLAASSEEQERWRVSDAPLAVPSQLTRSGLSAVLRQLLLEQQPNHDDGDGDDDDDDDDHEAAPSLSFDAVQFDFWIGAGGSRSPSGARLLRGGIEAQARKHGLSLEEAVPLYYFPLRAYRPREPTLPEPKLPDWISSVHYDPSSEVVVATCYDGSLHCYRDKKQRHSLSATEEIAATRAASANAPLKCCAVQPQQQRQSSSLMVATGAMDHTLRLHRLVFAHKGRDARNDAEKGDPSGRFDPVAQCVGHLSSVESVAFAPGGRSGDDGTTTMIRLASGEWSGGVCLWTTPTTHEHDDGEQVPSDGRKKAKTTTTGAATSSRHDAVREISPTVSLQAHAGNVSGLSFGNHHFRSTSATDNLAAASAADKLVTGSWDHTIKLWDVERQDNILSLNGSRVVSCLDTSYHTEGIVATGHPDCTLRLWDVRMGKDASSPALLVADQTTWKPSHRAWVASVSWSVESPYHLLSSSHDGTVKLWDLRASLPLQTLRAVTGSKDDKGRDDSGDGKVLGAAFGHDDQRIYAGGTDGQLHSFDRA